MEGEVDVKGSLVLAVPVQLTRTTPSCDPPTLSPKPQGLSGTPPRREESQTSSLEQAAMLAKRERYGWPVRQMCNSDAQ